MNEQLSYASLVSGCLDSVKGRYCYICNLYGKCVKFGKLVKSLLSCMTS